MRSENGYINASGRGRVRRVPVVYSLRQPTGRTGYVGALPALRTRAEAAEQPTLEGEGLMLLALLAQIFKSRGKI